MAKKFTVSAINTHVGQTITGNVRSHISTEKAGVVMTFDGPGEPGYEGTSRGVWVRGKGTNKLITYSNIQGIDVQEDGNEPILKSAK